MKITCTLTAGVDRKTVFEIQAHVWPLPDLKDTEILKAINEEDFENLYDHDDLRDPIWRTANYYIKLQKELRDTAIRIARANSIYYNNWNMGFDVESI